MIRLADEKGADLDSEGLAIDRDGTRLVSSETEPSVRRYGPDGRLLERLPVPAALQVAPAGRATANQTFEGLTLLPGGRTLLASMEYAIAGDSAGTVRFQTWQRRRGRFTPAAQYAYRTDPGLGVPEVQATPTAASSSWSAASPRASATPSASTSPTPATPPTPGTSRT